MPLGRLDRIGFGAPRPFGENAGEAVLGDGAARVAPPCGTRPRRPARSWSTPSPLNSAIAYSTCASAWSASAAKPAQPHRLAHVLFDAAALLVESAERILRFRVAGPRRDAQELGGALEILRKQLALDVEQRQVVGGERLAELGGGGEPFGGGVTVARAGAAAQPEHRQREHRLAVAAGSGQLVPLGRFLVVLGDADAMFALAMFNLQGRAGPRDRQKSAKLLADAAKLGHPIAAYDLALLYIEGQLFPQDFARAAELLRIAANAGNPQAQYALGTLYKEGRGIPKDIHEAVRLFSLAALADQADAEVEYGIALFNGDGVDRNQPLAAAYFRKAALAGNPIAQDRLATILANGLGVKADPVEAAKWHLISKAAGETDLALDEFVNNLDPKARAEAEKAARPWVDMIKRALAANEARGCGDTADEVKPAHRA